MRVAMRTVKHQLPFGQAGALHESEIGDLAALPGHAFVLVFEVVAAISGPELSGGREGDIMAMRMP